MKKILQNLFEYKLLTKKEAKNILIDINNNEFNETQITAFSIIYNMRPPCLEELKGFYEALMQLCVKINLDEFNTIDIVGTGGDKKNTFNISTTSCFIVAGAGGKVIKHGNYGSSSITGASNLLKNIGYIFTNKESELKKQLEKSGICYLHAPLFHPLLNKISYIRKNLGFKTFFNILGPIINPAKPKNIFIGVSDLYTARIYNYLHQETNINYNIIHSLDGYDEISLTENFKYYNKKGEYIITPEILGLKRLCDKEIIGGINTSKNIKIFLDILSGNGTKAQNTVVLTNAAFALCLINKNNFNDNFLLAKESLKSGKAKLSLKKFLNN